jgi:SAM-dependent methyltransferase
MAPGINAYYDAHADWYNHFITDVGGSEYRRRAHSMISDFLGPGAGTCLDVCCGTGAHTPVPAGLGWTLVGVDLSIGQLRYAVGQLPVAAADAVVLPFADNTFPAAMCILASTDVPDYTGLIRETARVLRPGGRFVHVGVHPCFVGGFAERRDPARIVVDEGYADRAHSFETWNPNGVRARVGGWHIPLADLLNAVTAAGLRLDRTAEAGATGVPELFGFVAVKKEDSV